MAGWMVSLMVIHLLGLPMAAVAQEAESGCMEGECHQELERKAFLHRPITERRCSPCHVEGPSGGEVPAHHSDVLSRPLEPPARGASVCEECHDQLEPSPSAFHNGEDDLHSRHALRPRGGRTCLLCHAPHQASNQALIRSWLPYGRERLTLTFEPTEVGGNCTTSCHIPIAYDREERIPSSMRIAEPPSPAEKP
ncbi:MAG: hypothetical protein JRH01_24190 [Deltaproteobacteria bacterium]|nr:hypothetical protein [Deltaproteobacteria bacterium]MBW2396932.1 hypothetical protein [Deltaproteobacteria bacterium]